MSVVGWAFAGAMTAALAFLWDRARRRRNRDLVELGALVERRSEALRRLESAVAEREVLVRRLDDLSLEAVAEGPREASDFEWRLDSKRHSYEVLIQRFVAAAVHAHVVDFYRPTDSAMSGEDEFESDILRDYSEAKRAHAAAPSFGHSADRPSNYRRRSIAAAVMRYQADSRNIQVHRP